jgi:F-type H+-transporting ATPase subunit b
LNTCCRRSSNDETHVNKENFQLELNWTTFVLEIVNFLVLVWILKHFLYKPVLDVIARRRAGIEKTLADAGERQANAEQLKQQYEGRLTEWERERQQAHEAMLQELEDERARRMQELQASLDQQQQRAQVAEERRRADERRQLEETALDQAARFASRLLEQASGPDTQARLVELAITDLGRLPDEKIEAMRNNFGRAPGEIIVTSAFELAGDQRQRLEKALGGLTEADLPLRFELQPDLLAGLRINIGSWVLELNIRDELRGFVELADHG